jgi:hypothetical protein
MELVTSIPARVEYQYTKSASWYMDIFALYRDTYHLSFNFFFTEWFKLYMYNKYTSENIWREYSLELWVEIFRVKTPHKTVKY